MRFLSVCSGIEAASVAWNPLGWEAVAFSEIEPFPCALLAHHYPHVPNWGDMTKFQEWPDANVDLLCGGTPCQSFSSAGLRRGLDDPRGQLMLMFGAIARRYQPRWIVWENVPGVLSSNGGRDFGAFLGMLGQLGYGFAYRVFDAQFVRVESHPRAVPQRRRRVFVVGHSGGLWQRAAAVLFERDSLRGHPAPCRTTGASVAALTAHGVGTCGADDNQGQAGHLIPEIVGQAMSCKWAKGTAGPAGDEHHNLLPVPFDPKQITSPGNRSNPKAGGPLNTLAAHADAPCIAFPARMSAVQSVGALNLSPTLVSKNPMAVEHDWSVRRLTPLECERLMGYPDEYTNVPHKGKPASDSVRYRALGNSWAINCARWIGERIRAVDAACAAQEAA